MPLPYHRSFGADRRAATALEFALVCGPFMIFLLGVMGVGLQFFQQQALDFALQQAVRQVQLGHVSGYTQAQFVDTVFCPLFAQFQSCDSVFVDVRPVSDYASLSLPGTQDAPDSTGTTGLMFCSGRPGQLMYAHVVYQAPMIGGVLLGAASNAAVVANAAFANENPTGTPVPVGTGC